MPSAASLLNSPPLWMLSTTLLEKSEEVFHFPPSCIPINSGCTPPLPVSHWHTNTQVKRLWSAAERTVTFLHVNRHFCPLLHQTKGQNKILVCVRKIHSVCECVCVLSSGLPLLPLYCQSELLLFDYTDTPTVESALCNWRHLQPDYAIRAKWSPGFHLCSLHLPLHLQPDVNRRLRHAASHYTTTIYGVSFNWANKTRFEPAAESDLLRGQWGIFLYTQLD